MPHELKDADYAWALRIAGGWCRRRGVIFDDELRQEVRLALLRCAPKYSAERGASFKTFAGYRVLGALKETIRSRLGSRSRRKRFEANLISLDAPSRTAKDADRPLLCCLRHHDGDPVAAAETRELFERAVELAGNKRDREIVRMRAGGLTYAEIGQELGVSEWCVGLLVRKIRERLREPLLG